MNNKHESSDLSQMQFLSLDSKIEMSKQRIKAYYDYFDGNVYVSYSGGKDSTVVLHLARSIYPDIKACYIDTGLEYPEVRKHAKSQSNIDIIKPKLTFKEVIEQYGIPFPSKEVANTVFYAKAVNDTKFKTTRIERLNGTHTREDGTLSAYNCSNWKFLLDAPFQVHSACCDVMKKRPIHKYNKDTGKNAILGTMATESRLRKQSWIKYGCNAFELKNPQSRPISFWTEQDILEYIKRYDLKIPSVYGEIVETSETYESIDGIHKKLKTTGVERTGCMFCMFGCNKNTDHRFELMRESHPKVYEYLMKPKSDGGLGYKDIIDWINSNSNCNIKY